MTQNFNQISKTATNLLNEIYEKHLLNQTTFDGVGGVPMNGGPGSTSKYRGNGCIGDNRLVGGASTSGKREADFNFNNLCNLESPRRGEANRNVHKVAAGMGANGNANLSSPAKLTVSKAAKSRLPAKKSIGHPGDGCGGSGGISGNSGISGISGSDCVSGKLFAKNPRKFPSASSGSGVSGNDENLFEASYAQPSGNEKSVFYESSDYGPHKHFYTKQPSALVDGGNGGGGGGGKLTTTIRGEPVGGNVFEKNRPVDFPVAVAPTGDAPVESNTNCEYANSKINIMLETAQAMAAAAYFARFVSFFIVLLRILNCLFWAKFMLLPFCGERVGTSAGQSSRDECAFRNVLVQFNFNIRLRNDSWLQSMDSKFLFSLQHSSICGEFLWENRPEANHCF